MKNLFVLLAVLLVTPVFAQKKSETVIPFQPNFFKNYPNVRDLAISPDGQEVYFTVESLKKEVALIVRANYKRGKLTNPAVAPFSGNFNDLEPAFSPDGLTLFFVSNRPLDAADTVAKPDFDIWYLQRKNVQAAWSEPMNVGSPVNSARDEFYPSVGASGTLYFTAQRTGGKGKEDIWMSTWQDGNFQEPVVLSDSVNSGNYEFNAFISPDEQVLLFTAYGRPDDLGGGDLYFSTIDQRGNWSKARSLGPAVNSPKIDYCPFIDFKTQRLFFTSERSNVVRKYRRRAKLPDYLQEMQQFSNGRGRIYVLPLAKSNLPAGLYVK